MLIDEKDCVIDDDDDDDDSKNNEGPANESGRALAPTSRSSVSSNSKGSNIAMTNKVSRRIASLLNSTATTTSTSTSTSSSSSSSSSSSFTSSTTSSSTSTSSFPSTSTSTSASNSTCLSPYYLDLEGYRIPNYEITLLKNPNNLSIPESPQRLEILKSKTTTTTTTTATAATVSVGGPLLLSATSGQEQNEIIPSQGIEKLTKKNAEKVKEVTKQKENSSKVFNFLQESGTENDKSGCTFSAIFDRHQEGDNSDNDEDDNPDDSNDGNKSCTKKKNSGKSVRTGERYIIDNPG